MPKSKTVKFLLLLLLWTVLGFFFVIQQYIYSASVDSPFNWFNNITYRVPSYILWAFFTPLIYAIVNRLTFSRNYLIKNITTLFILAVGVSLLHRFLSILITFSIRDLYGTLNPSLSQALQNARFAIFGGSFDSLFIFLLILSVILGLVYYKRLRETEKLSTQLETQLAEAKLESLKSQLHPHFLFNTLHAISTLMRRDVDLAEKMLIRLSDLLRISLDHLDQQKIKLKDELEFLEKYLEIQHVRFQDKLKVDMQVESSLYDLLIPSFILQPIVENSIKYSVEPSSEKELVSVAAEKDGGLLVLTVEDSGPGLPNSFEKGVGIKNTITRLQQIYGDNYETSFENKTDGGLIVTIKIPVEE